MVIVGWWVSRRGGGQVEVPPDTHTHHEEPVSHAEPTMAEVRQEAPVVAAAEASAVPHAVAVPDDLVRLEGIGPRVARVLNDAGITTFAALASANAGDIQKILSAAGLQMMNPEGWIEQAALAAK